MIQIRTKTIALVVGILLIAYSVGRIVTLDAYGQCYNPLNFKLCLYGSIDAWMDNADNRFHRLISDDEMIVRFKLHRAEFDEMVAYATRPKLNSEFSPEMLGKRELGNILGIDSVTRHWVCTPHQDTPLAPCRETPGKWGEFELRADVTKIIDERFWPHSNLVKYYAYYPEEQFFESDQKSQTQLQLQPSLDKDWPDGWPVPNENPHCLLRRIDAHWYLKLCKNDIGG